MLSCVINVHNYGVNCTSVFGLSVLTSSTIKSIFCFHATKTQVLSLSTALISAQEMRLDRLLSTHQCLFRSREPEEMQLLDLTLYC